VTLLERVALLTLAVTEEKAFLDARMDRLYWAMCQHNRLLLAPDVAEKTARYDLDAALDAVSDPDIRRHMMAPEPPDSIYENMLELKAEREATLAQEPAKPTQAAEPTDDSEPEQTQ
jgi:tRNA A37 threonylcarbamoyladenosine modification protein TsaB